MKWVWAGEGVLIKSQGVGLEQTGWSSWTPQKQVTVGGGARAWQILEPGHSSPFFSFEITSQNTETQNDRITQLLCPPLSLGPTNFLGKLRIPVSGGARVWPAVGH